MAEHAGEPLPSHAWPTALAVAIGRLGGFPPPFRRALVVVYDVCIESTANEVRSWNPESLTERERSRFVEREKSRQRERGWKGKRSWDEKEERGKKLRSSITRVGWKVMGEKENHDQEREEGGDGWGGTHPLAHLRSFKIFKMAPSFLEFPFLAQNLQLICTYNLTPTFWKCFHLNPCEITNLLFPKIGDFTSCPFLFSIRSPHWLI